MKKVTGYSATASTSPLGGFSLGSNPSTPTSQIIVLSDKSPIAGVV